MLACVLLALGLGAWGYFEKGRRDPGSGSQCAPSDPARGQTGGASPDSRHSAAFYCASYVFYNTIKLFTLGADEPWVKREAATPAAVPPMGVAVTGAGPGAGPGVGAVVPEAPREAIWQIHLARLMLGVLAVYGALLVLGGASKRVRWFMPILAIRMRRPRHLVIGIGAKGEQFIFHRGHVEGERVVGLDLHVRPAIQWLEGIHTWRWLPAPRWLRLFRKVVLVEGDARNPDVLRRCGLLGVPVVTVVCANDGENLEIARVIQEVFARHVERQTRRWWRWPSGAPTDPAGTTRVPVYVHVGNRAVRAEMGRHEPAAGGGVVFRYFSVHQLAARLFWQKFKLPYEADIQGHSRLHVVLIGFGDMAEEMLTLVAILWPYREMTAPLVTIIAGDPSGTERRIKARYPNLHRAAQWRVVPIALIDGEIESDTLVRIEQGCEDGPPNGQACSEGDARTGFIADRRAPPVSAVFLCTENDMANVAMAHRFRLLAQTTGRCRAPIYAHVWAEVDFTRATAPCLTEARFSRVIQEFGLLAEVCCREGMGVMVDRLAALMQFQYAEDVKARLDKGTYPAFARKLRDRPDLHDHLIDLQGGALLPFIDAFERQPDLVCEMNRMPALHFAIKALAAGYAFPLPYEYRFCWPVRLPGVSEQPDQQVRPRVAFDAGRLAPLDDAEHRRWMNDRFVTGWRWGARRDDRRLIHPKLQPLNPNDPERLKDEAQILVAFLPWRMIDEAWRDRASRGARDRQATAQHSWVSQLGLGDLAYQPLRWERWAGLAGEADPDPASFERACPDANADVAWIARVDAFIAQLPPRHEAQTVLVTRLQCGEETAFVHALFARLREAGDRAPLLRCFVVEAIPRLERVRRYARRCAEAATGCGTLPEVFDPAARAGRPPAWIRWLSRVSGAARVIGRREYLAYRLTRRRLRRVLREAGVAPGARVVPAMTAPHEDRLLACLDGATGGVSAGGQSAGERWTAMVALWRDELTDAWTRLMMDFYENGPRPFMKPEREMPSLDWVVELHDQRAEDKAWPPGDFGLNGKAFLAESAYMEARGVSQPVDPVRNEAT